MNKEWVDMTDTEKKKEDIETYFVEFILDCQREIFEYYAQEINGDKAFYDAYEKKFQELKQYIERGK